jgi:hypothetical protein
MATTGKNSFHRAHDDELSTENQESTTHVVVAFRNRNSSKTVGDTLHESADCVDEVEQPATIHPRHSVGGEVLLW